MIMLDKFIVGLFLGFILGIVGMIVLAAAMNNKDKDE